jgi:hypothetical protein
MAVHAMPGRHVDGTLRLGAPQDIAEDHLPEVLQKFSALSAVQAGLGVAARINALRDRERGVVEYVRVKGGAQLGGLAGIDSWGLYLDTPGIVKLT